MHDLKIFTHKFYFFSLTIFHLNCFYRVKDTDKVPMILIGNKIDDTFGRQVTTREGSQLAQSWGVPFMETSAKNHMDSQNCFRTVVREIRKFEGEKVVVEEEPGNIP